MVKPKIIHKNILSQLQKNITSSTTYKQLLYEAIEELPYYKHIYTDASKTDNGTGIAIIASNFQIKKK